MNLELAINQYSFFLQTTHVKCQQLIIHIETGQLQCSGRNGPFKLRSSQFIQANITILQIFLKGLYNLYSIRQPLSVDQ